MGYVLAVLFLGGSLWRLLDARDGGAITLLAAAMEILAVAAVGVLLVLLWDAITELWNRIVGHRH
jgi:hypothetical protein